jgi:hypothetical protein
MFLVSLDRVSMDSDRLRVERFKLTTREKLQGVRCPEHRQPPRLHFHGSSLREITISLSGCCERLMDLANARIALAESPRSGRESGEPLREKRLRPLAG